MSGFHEALFPPGISLNTEGGPTRRTEIIALASGREVRNAQWAAARRSYNAGYGVKSMADIETVVAFFEARQGRLYGFRFRDPFDHRSSRWGAEPSPTDQFLGEGDGAARRFQLVKRYDSAGAASGSGATRRIAKPVAGSVACAIDGAPIVAFVDPATGIVEFAEAPPPGARITAGFYFDTPVRFDTDSLRINLAAFSAGDIPSIPLIEVFV